MSEEEQQANSSQFNTVDEAKMKALSRVCETFEEIPPELSDFAKDNQALISIADNIHSICNPTGDTLFPQKDLNDFELAIRTFIFNMSNSAVRDQTTKDREQSNENRIMTQQLAESKEETRQREDQINKLQKEIEKLQDKLEKSQQEAKDYLEKFNQSNEKIKRIRHENGDQQKQLKVEIDNLNEEKQSIIAKLKMAEFTNTRLSKSLDLANEENAQLHAELTTIKSKAEAKSSKLKQATSNYAQLQLKMRQVDADNQRLITEQNEFVSQLKDLQNRLIESNPENLKKLEEEKNAYMETCAKLQEQMDLRANDYIASRKEQTELTRQVNEKDEQIKDLEEENEKLNQQLNDLRNRNTELTRQTDALSQQVEETQREMSNYNPSSILYESLNDESKSKIEKKFGKVTEDQIPALFQSLLDGNTNDELIDQNKRLVSILENQLRFLSSAVVRSIIDPKLLSPDSSSSPLNQDLGARDRMFVEIARTRQFLQTNCDTQPQKMSEQDMQKIFEKLQNGADLAQREAFVLIAIEASNNDTIRRYCDKILSQNQTIISQLVTVADVVNCNGQLQDIVPAVVEKLKNFQQFSKKMKNILNGDFDSTKFDDTLAFLLQYASTTSKILKDFDTDLRDALQFEGELAEMPDYATQAIKELKDIIAKAKEESIQGMRNQVTQLRREMAEEQEKAGEQIAKLEEEVSQKDDVIADLNNRIKAEQDEKKQVQQELYTTEQEKADAEQKLNTILQSYNDLEADLESAKKETEEMREQMQKKQKTFEERLDSIIADERKSHAEDLKHFEDKLKAREERLRLEINTKSQKLQQAKQKLRDVIDTYDKAFKQQKETTAQLRQQNNELIDRLQIHEPRQKAAKGQTGVSSVEVENLKAEVRNLMQDKADLETQLEQAEAKAQKEQNTREKSWEQKLQDKQSEIESVRAEEEAKRQEIEKNMIGDILSSLAPYAPKNANDLESAIQTARDVCERLTQAEQDLDNLKRSKSIKSMPNAYDMQRTEQINSALQDWDRWARDLYVNVTDGQVPKQSTKDLRYALSEMVLASIGHRKLIWRLEALRAEKKALLSGVRIPRERTTPQIKMRATLLTVLGAVRIVRKAGRYQSVFD